MKRSSETRREFALRVDRRLFVLAGLAALARPAEARVRRSRGGPARTLVLIQLSGGNDGLSTLVPYADEAYAKARRATRLGADEVLRLDERVGLHPKLAGLRELFERGRLALFEGVGYPQPDRSHFRSLDVWHAADARGRGMGTGWIGRCAERLESVEPQATPHIVVHFGPRPPFALHSVLRAPLCLTPLLMHAATDNESPRMAPETPAPADVRPAGGAALALVRKRLRETRDSTVRLRAALERSGPVAYPASDFAQDLRNAAALIHAELGVRVCSLELDGFDTHRDQRQRHDRLMAELDRGLRAFAEDLEQSEAGREALVLLFSEFGRRVEENASGGTDHGAAGLGMALGARVRGGLHGKPPALDALADGDLAFTTDFRALYARCIEHVFELDAASVLGASYPGPEFV